MEGVDVIIPLFNCASFIERAIISVQNQLKPVSKIIVINDGSTDTGPLIVSNMARNDKRIILLNGPNQGLSAARNKGIRASSEAFIAFLDADDAWEPEKIAKEFSVISNSPYSFVHTQARAIDTSDQLIDVSLYKSNPNISPSFDNIRLGIYPVVGSASSVLTRRELLFEAGLFDENQHFGGEDWDMWARLAQFGPACLIDEPLTRIRIVPSSLQRSMSGEDRARSRLHSRIMVASHWQNDMEFLLRHRKEARKDVWAVLRWLLLKPTALYQFYIFLRHHDEAAGRIIVTNIIDYISLIVRGMIQTVIVVIGSPGECKRLWNRFKTERNL